MSLGGGRGDVSWIALQSPATRVPVGKPIHTSTICATFIQIKAATPVCAEVRGAPNQGATRVSTKHASATFIPRKQRAAESRPPFLDGDAASSTKLGTAQVSTALANHGGGDATRRGRRTFDVD